MPKALVARKVFHLHSELSWQEKSPDRRVPGLSFPRKGKYAERDAKLTTQYSDALTEPVGGLVRDIMVVTYANKPAQRSPGWGTEASGSLARFGSARGEGSMIVPGIEGTPRHEGRKFGFKLI